MKILAPVDLAERSSVEQVIGEAVRLAEATSGELTVLTVVPDIVTGIDYRYAIRGEQGGSQDFDLKKIVAEALERLNTVVSELTPDAMEVATIARHGTIYEQVLKVAEELEPDQIIMGAHRPGVADFLLGHNTARVVRHAKCSVNVLRAPE